MIILFFFLLFSNQLNQIDLLTTITGEWEKNKKIDYADDSMPLIDCNSSHFISFSSSYFINNTLFISNEKGKLHSYLKLYLIDFYYFWWWLLLRRYSQQQQQQNFEESRTFMFLSLNDSDANYKYLYLYIYNVLLLASQSLNNNKSNGFVYYYSFRFVSFISFI